MITKISNVSSWSQDCSAMKRRYMLYTKTSTMHTIHAFRNRRPITKYTTIGKSTAARMPFSVMRTVRTTEATAAMKPRVNWNTCTNSFNLLKGT